MESTSTAHQKQSRSNSSGQQQEQSGSTCTKSLVDEHEHSLQAQPGLNNNSAVGQKERVNNKFSGELDQRGLIAATFSFSSSTHSSSRPVPPKRRDAHFILKTLLVCNSLKKGYALAEAESKAQKLTTVYLAPSISRQPALTLFFPNFQLRTTRA